MSTQAIGASAYEGANAAAERVHQIETMIEQARTGIQRTASGASSSASSFASTLQAASTPSATTASVSYGAESGAGGEQYEAMIDQAAARNGIEPALLYGLVEQESGFNSQAQSSAGAMGLTQLMPGTASSMGVSNPYDPTESLEGGARYLSQLMSEFSGNVDDALAAYNAGPAAVAEHGGVPPYAETESYVGKVLANAEAFRQTHATTGTGTLL